MEYRMTNGFKTDVRTGARLRTAALSVAGWEKRDCYAVLDAFLNGPAEDRVCVLYGLRRTGKTTLLRQAILDIMDNEQGQVAYIRANPNSTMADLDDDLELLAEQGFQYVFIDEITLMEDFIRMAGLLSDVYAAEGMKIVLSGTDSLGFWLTEGDELYDRMRVIHTTFIPFREHSRLLGVGDVDEYIRYGGTLRAGETAFDDPDAIAPDASFRDDESTRRYIDTAISRNIQNSLRHYDHGGHFRHLRELYEHDELTGAINRIIEDMNHDFLLSVLERSFKSHHFRSAAEQLQKERRTEPPTLNTYRRYEQLIAEKLMDVLNTRRKPDMTVELNDAHVWEIKEYLAALDLILECPVSSVSPDQQVRGIDNVLFTQLGMRFFQAQALVHSVMDDPAFSDMSEELQNRITKKILADIRNQMLEDVVLLETLKAAPYKTKVLKLLLAMGIVVMIVYDTKANRCDVFKVCHGVKAVERLERPLVRPGTRRQIEHKYGEIRNTCVIYRGESGIAENGVLHCNVNEYLCSLGNWKGGENQLLRYIAANGPRIHFQETSDYVARYSPDILFRVQDKMRDSRDAHGGADERPSCDDPSL